MNLLEIMSIVWVPSFIAAEHDPNRFLNDVVKLQLKRDAGQYRKDFCISIGGRNLNMREHDLANVATSLRNGIFSICTASAPADVHNFTTPGCRKEFQEFSSFCLPQFLPRLMLCDIAVVVGRYVPDMALL